MKKEADYFDDHEPKLIYIARRLSDATKLEGILTAEGIDYGVEADQYQGGIVFRTTRTGAFFYVREEEKERAIDVLLSHGFVPATETNS